MNKRAFVPQEVLDEIQTYRDFIADIAHGGYPIPQHTVDRAREILEENEDG